MERELEESQAYECRRAAAREQEHQRQMKVLRRKTWAACIMALLASAGWWAWVAKATTADMQASTAAERREPAPGPDETWAEDALTDAADAGVIARPMPSEPLKNQKRPPCDSWQVAISGGCWEPLERRPVEGKCAGSAYESDGKCYIPVQQAKRPPTSVDGVQP